MTVEDIEAAAELFAEGREFLYNDADSFRGGVREGIRAIVEVLKLAETSGVRVPAAI